MSFLSSLLLRCSITHSVKFIYFLKTGNLWICLKWELLSELAINLKKKNRKFTVMDSNRLNIFSCEYSTWVILALLLCNNLSTIHLKIKDNSLLCISKISLYAIFWKGGKSFTQKFHFRDDVSWCVVSTSKKESFQMSR